MALSITRFLGRCILPRLHASGRGLCKVRLDRTLGLGLDVRFFFLNLNLEYVLIYTFLCDAAWYLQCILLLNRFGSPLLRKRTGYLAINLTFRQAKLLIHTDTPGEDLLIFGLELEFFSLRLNA